MTKERNKYKKFFIMYFIFLFSLAFIAGANTITLDAPAQDDSISGSYSINSSLDTNTLYITTVDFYYKIGAGSWIPIGTIVNSSANQTMYNKTFVTTTLIDDDDLTFNVTANSNSTSGITTDTSTGVDIDNGNPTTTLSSSTFSEGQSFSRDETYTIGIDADNTIGVSSCVVYYETLHGAINVTLDVVASGNACSLSTTPASQGLAIGGAYSVIIEATDGNNDKTNSSARTLGYSPDPPGGGFIASEIFIIKEQVISLEQIQNTFKNKYNFECVGECIYTELEDNQVKLEVREQRKLFNLFTITMNEVYYLNADGEIIKAKYNIWSRLLNKNRLQI